MPLLKRSVSLAGHRTSLSLEAEFWAVIDAAIRADGVSLAGLIAQIDEARGLEPLASSMRVWALKRAQASESDQRVINDRADAGPRW
ncbi:ribbon-helix-helix domain-containing protein [uncultured Maricaulis sp.]|uniref:ribbon-helix-helix domain-containing protein n=1 Tax=uncultured Maricaulis sp. TaxID=174710 RepID=UPI0030D9B8FD|tara:strand:+ start:18206 stop:18466 length:261 start_codon:yes stop_codon:yes gene_type:complete